MTCGQIEDFPDAPRGLLKKARQDACDIIHALDSYKPWLSPKNGVTPYPKSLGPNPFVGLGPEERNKKMLDTVVSVYAVLDEHYPRLPGEGSRSEIFARHYASVTSVPQ